MRAEVTCRSRSARGVQLDDGATRFVEPGETLLLDLADHILHAAWVAAGDLQIVAAPEPHATPSPTPRDRAARRGRAG